MSNWTDFELKLLKEVFPKRGVRGLKIVGINKSNIEIVEKAIELGLTVTEANIKLPTKDDYVDFIKQGIIVPKGWDSKEISRLLGLYPSEGAMGCIRAGVNKSYFNIRKMANYLGIEHNVTKSKSVRRDSGYWTTAKIKKLLDVYDNRGLCSCYSEFKDISKASVKYKILEYRELKKGSWSEEELELLRKYFPIGGRRLVKEKGVDRTLESISTKATSLGIKHIKK